MGKKKRPWRGPRPVLLWDLPTRLFHWMLVALVAASFATGQLGGNAMVYHERCGETVLALLLFRVAWGFIGSGPSRFRSFLARPSIVLRYARTFWRRDAEPQLGHNPLGGWFVMAMLLTLLIQAGTGLLADDDIATENPLYKWVRKAASDRLASIHFLNQDVVIILVAVHVAAVLFYLIYKRENLITPMITGRKSWKGPLKADMTRAPLWQAALAAAGASAAVYLLTR